MAETSEGTIYKLTKAEKQRVVRNAFKKIWKQYKEVFIKLSGG